MKTSIAISRQTRTTLRILSMFVKKKLVVLLDRFKHTEDESDLILEVIFWVVDGKNDSAFQFFLVENKENFYNNSYFNLLRFFKKKEIDFNKSNFNDSFFQLLLRKMNQNIAAIARSMKENDQLQMLSELSKSLEFLFFILFKCSEIVGYVKFFPLDNICNTLLKVFPKIELIKQISLVTKICMLFTFYEKKFPNFSIRLKNFLFSLYFENFYDLEIRSFIACNILDFAAENPFFIQTRISDFFSQKYCKRMTNYRLSCADYTLLEISMKNINEKQTLKVNELIAFFEFISGSISWQFIFFQELYASVIDRFWFLNSPFEKNFLMFWDHFFNRILEQSFNIFKGKKGELMDAIKIDCIPNIILLKKVLRINGSFFKTKLMHFCNRIETHVCEYLAKFKKKFIDQKFDYNVYIKMICDLMGYSLKEIQLQEQERDSKKNVKKNKPKKKRKTDIQKNEKLECEVHNSSVEKKYSVLPNEIKSSHNFYKVSVLKNEGSNLKKQPFSKCRSCFNFGENNLKIANLIANTNKNETSALASINSNNHLKNVQFDHLIAKTELNDKIIKNNNDLVCSELIERQSDIKSKHINIEISYGIDILNKLSLQKQLKNKLNEQQKKEEIMNLQKNKKKLSLAIEKRLNHHGGSLFEPKRNLSPYQILRKRIDVDRIDYYSHCFNPESISSIENKALLNNFKIHKNLIKSIFNKFACIKTVKMTNEEGFSEIINSEVISIHQIIVMMKSFGNDYAQTDHNQIRKIINFVNSKSNSVINVKNCVNFSDFHRFLFQLTYYVHSGFLKEKGPFECFQIFLENLREKTNDQLLFVNDHMLLSNVDKKLLSYYQSQIQNDPYFVLPLNFKCIEIAEYGIDKNEPEIIKKESKRVCSSILRDLILDNFEINLLKCRISKRKVFIVIQEHPIDTSFEANKHIHQNNSVEKSNIFLEDEKNMLKKFPNKFEIKGNDFLHKKRFKIVGNPINDLSLSMKLLVISSPDSLKQNYLCVANLLEQVLKKVELLSFQKNIKISEQTGKILNSVLIKNQTKIEKENQSRIFKKSSSQIIHAFIKKKKEKSKSRQKSKSLSRKKNTQNFEKNAETMKKIEEYRNLIKIKKENEIFKQLEKEKKEKENFLQLVTIFKNKSMPKLKMYIKNLEAKGKEKLKLFENELSFKIPIQKNLEIYKSLHQFNEIKKMERFSFISQIEKLHQNIEFKLVLEKYNPQLVEVFKIYSNKYSTSNFIKRADEEDINFYWGLREFRLFLKDHLLLILFQDDQEIKNVFERIVLQNTVDKIFRFCEFLTFLIQLYVKSKNQSDEKSNYLYESAKFEVLLTNLFKKQVHKVFIFSNIQSKKLKMSQKK